MHDFRDVSLPDGLRKYVEKVNALWDQFGIEFMDKNTSPYELVKAITSSGLFERFNEVGFNSFPFRFDKDLPLIALRESDTPETAQVILTRHLEMLQCLGDVRCAVHYMGALAPQDERRKMLTIWLADATKQYFYSAQDLANIDSQMFSTLNYIAMLVEALSGVD